MIILMHVVIDGNGDGYDREGDDDGDKISNQKDGDVGKDETSGSYNEIKKKSDQLKKIR